MCTADLGTLSLYLAGSGTKVSIYKKAIRLSVLWPFLVYAY